MSKNKPSCGKNIPEIPFKASVGKKPPNLAYGKVMI